MEMKKPHILIVEDDAEMRETLSDILSEEGYEVKTTEKGKEALTLAREEKEKFPFAVYLIDLKLLDISGIEVLRGLKELNPESYAIIMTAFASKNTAIEALKAGAYSYVEKPVNMEELLHVIKRASDSYQLQEEKKRAEEKLKNAEERYRVTFEHTGTAMAILEEDTTISLCNKEVEELSGYSKAEIEGKKSWTEFVHSDDLEKMRRYHEERRKESGKAPTNYEFRAVDRKGNVKNIYLSIELIPGTKKSVISLIDITERKRAEDALRQKVEEQKVLLSTMPAFVYFKDRNDNYIVANKAFADMTDTPIDEIAGKTDYDFFPKEEADFYRKCDQEVMESGEPKYNIEETVTGADGKKMWVSTSKTPLFDSDGDIIGMVGITLDITERKRSEEELKKSRKFFETVIENIPDTITLRDSEQRFVLANQAYCNITGVTKHEIIGKKGEYKETNDKVFQTGRMIESPELTYTGVDGVRHYVHSKKVPLTDESGNITHVLTISRDITERKRAEEKIRQAEKEWRDSFNSLGDAMIVVDTNFVIERVNKAAEELVGKPKEEIIGMKCYNVFHNIDNPARNCPLKKSLKTKKVETVERYEQKFGRYFSGKSSPILDENGEIIKSVYLMRDITERKRAEKELEKYTKELERVNQDLEDFTSTVSHDLKAPLRSIQAFNTLLMEDYADTLDETGRGYLNKVKGAVERMSVQIEDLLTLSRVGRKFIEIETVDMNELLEEIKTDISARIEERGGEVVVGKLPPISTQRIWLKELFTNLIDNGLKFNRADKPKVEVSCEEREQDYLFKVEDNGIGIEEKYLDKIFMLFERLHSLSEYEGTGAGLAICKKIVEGLGGALRVESKPGEGSTFCFTMDKLPSKGTI